MITVDNKFLEDKFLEFNIFAEDQSVDIVLNATTMLKDSEDMEIYLNNIKVSKDDGTEICNLGDIFQYAITKEISDLELTGNNTIYVLNKDYDNYKSKLPFEINENREYLNIKGVSEYEKYLNFMGKLLNSRINTCYADFIEAGDHYTKMNVRSVDKLPVCMLIYDTEYEDDDSMSTLLAVIVTEEMNGINNKIYQIERGV